MTERDWKMLTETPPEWDMLGDIKESFLPPLMGWNGMEANKIYLGDCLELMRELPDKSVDAVITDPPYGISMDKGFSGSCVFGGKGKPIERRVYTGVWDKSSPAKECFDEMLRVSKSAVIWGGNFFTDKLPQANHWVVWDKFNTMPSFGDCELAWTNIPRNSVKILRHEYNGLLGKEQERYHPTQKPVQVMTWVIANYTDPDALILDPFIGSGTTAVACIRTGRRFIGMEIDKGYYEIAQRRIQNELAQYRLELT